MHRCTNADNKTTAVGAYDGSVDVYRDEIVGVNPATQLRHKEMNAIQEEVANVIRSTGVALQTDAETPAQMIQLNTAVDAKDTAAKAVAAADATAKVDAHFLCDFTTTLVPMVTAVPTPTFYQEVTGNFGIMKHGIAGQRMCLVTMNFYFNAYTAMNYLIVTLPSGYRPFRFYLGDAPLVKVACGKVTTGGVYTDLEGIYARPFRDGAAGKIYIGNKELASGTLPVTTSFPATAPDATYTIGFTMAYHLYTGE